MAFFFVNLTHCWLNAVCLRRNILFGGSVCWIKNNNDFCWDDEIHYQSRYTRSPNKNPLDSSKSRRSNTFTESLSFKTSNGSPLENQPAEDAGCFVLSWVFKLLFKSFFIFLCNFFLSFFFFYFEVKLKYQNLHQIYKKSVRVLNEKIGKKEIKVD